MDNTYLEYDANATVDTDPSSCLNLIVVGCTDENAINVNPDANTPDDTMCEYAILCEEGLAGFQLKMMDSYGDSWNGNTFDLVDVNGEVAYTATLQSGTLSESVDVCLAPGCYSYSVDGGSYQSEFLGRFI